MDTREPTVIPSLGSDPWCRQFNYSGRSYKSELARRMSRRAEHIAAGKRWSKETAQAIYREGNWPDRLEYPHA